MPDGMPSIDIRSSPELAEQFLQALVTDDGLRERLQSRGEDAVAALAEYDIFVTPDLLDEQTELPSPDEIREVLELMDPAELSPEYAVLREGANMKFWPIFWWLMKFRPPFRRSSAR